MIDDDAARESHHAVQQRFPSSNESLMFLTFWCYAEESSLHFEVESRVESPILDVLDLVGEKRRLLLRNLVRCLFLRVRWMMTVGAAGHASSAGLAGNCRDRSRADNSPVMTGEETLTSKA